MTNIRIDKIQIKRGTVANLPTLDDGELFYAYDTKEHYLGMGGVNQLLSKDFASLNQHYEGVLSRFGINSNGKLTIDSVEFAGGGGSAGSLVFNTLADLQAAYPNGTTQPAWIVADNAWYYWSGAIVTDTTAPVLTITAGGTFTGTKSVTMSVNETADIYYTLDGSTPTTSSAKYTSPLSISATTTLKAFAKDVAGNSSTVQTVTYTLDATPPADTTAPDNVTNLVYSNLAQTSLTLSWTASASSDVASYDVYNGATLLANVTGTTYGVSGLSASTQYTFAVKAKDAANNVASGTSVTVTTSAPADTTAPVLTITPAATFTTTQTVNMSANETATIYYTLDDSDPKTSGTKLTYTSPLTLTETDTVKAYARDTAGNESAVQTVTYTKQTGTTPGTVLISDTFNRADSTSLGSAETGQAWTDFSSANGTVTHGISNNQFYLSGGTFTASAGKFRRQATQTVSTNNFELETKITIPANLSATMAIGLRVNTDADIVYLGMNASGGTVPRYTITKLPSGGNATNLGSGTKVPTNGDVVKVKHYSDGKIEVYVNEVLDVTVTDTYLLAATTKVGLGMDNNTLTFDYFKVTAM